MSHVSLMSLMSLVSLMSHIPLSCPSQSLWNRGGTSGATPALPLAQQV